MRRSRVGENKKLRISLLVIGWVLIAGGLILLVFSGLHVARWFEQPRFVSLSGDYTTSPGFLVTASFFGGAGIIVLIAGMIPLVCAHLKHRYRNRI